jgi:signal transduction histidine kinase
MTSMGQSAFELAHKLGNELGTVRLYVENIQDELSSRGIKATSVDDELNKILRDVGQVLELSSGLKEAFRDFKEDERPSQALSSLPPRVLLKEAERSVHDLPKTIKVNYEISEDVALVRADPRQAADILWNLLTNARDAMPHGGTITLRARNAGRFVEFQVADTGAGIPAEMQPRIFHLFYSTKSSFGFGLWSARRHALANSGELTVASEPGHGATFTLLLPRSEEPPEIAHA